MRKTFKFSSLNIHDKNGPATFEFTTEEGLLEVIDSKNKLSAKLNGVILYEIASVIYDINVDRDIFNSNPSKLLALSFESGLTGVVIVSDFTQTSGWTKISAYSS